MFIISYKEKKIKNLLFFYFILFYLFTIKFLLLLARVFLVCMYVARFIFPKHELN